MRKKEFTNFLVHCDAVCLHCTELSGQNCRMCPVRKTISYYEREMKNDIDFEKVNILDGEKEEWIMLIKPEKQDSFCVYPTRKDVKKYLTAIQKGDEECIEQMKHKLAKKYYVMAKRKPDMKVNIFNNQVTAEDLAKIEHVNVFKTTAREGKPSVFLLSPTIDGKKVQGREISQLQWKLMWLVDDMHNYQIRLAASLFVDLLHEQLQLEE